MRRFSQGAPLQAIPGCRARQRNGAQMLGRALQQEISAMRKKLVLNLTSQHIPHNNFKLGLFKLGSDLQGSPDHSSGD